MAPLTDTPITLEFIFTIKHLFQIENNINIITILNNNQNYKINSIFNLNFIKIITRKS